MTHISKHQLKPRHLDELFIQLGKTLVKLDKNNFGPFLDEFLGEEEKIMLAKRLAVIAMCIEGNSPYRIGQLLKMSPSTTERIKLKYEIGKYKEIEKILTGNKKDYEQFWSTLEIILRAGMPPMGRGRWKSIFKS
jgi:uncharacterized protein YerC